MIRMALQTATWLMSTMCLALLWMLAMAALGIQL